MEEKSYPCKDVVPIEQEPRHHLAFANEFARFFVVEIAPLERTLCHYHGLDYLMYVMGDGEIVSAPRDGAPKTLTYHDGDCELSPAGLVHVVENLRETKFRNLVVELLPRLGELQRAGDPRISAGHGAVKAIFEEERISVWSVEMKSGAQAEVYGPAIVATLWDERRLSKHPGDLTVKAHNVGDVSWILSDRVLLDRSSNPWDWAIVFQLGRTEEKLAAARKRADEPRKSLRAHAQEPQ